MDDILVCIRCLTYNHEPFIRQCLEGFVMQKTNFCFVVIVHDDASTDGTAAIILEYAKKYPGIIKPIIETENQYSKHDGSLARIMNEHTCGKYVALCEGDDYWIDPYKLQKQVDFLENHPDFGMVHTKAHVLLNSENKILCSHRGGDFTSIDDLLLSDKIATLTTCFRKEYLDSYPIDIDINNEWQMGDYPLWLYIASKSKIYFIDEFTAVYRVLNESASHFSDWEKHVNFILSFFDIEYYFMNKLHHEYMHKKIAQRLFSIILNIHNANNQRLNVKYYKEKLKIDSLGCVFMFKCYLRLLKHKNWIK